MDKKIGGNIKSAEDMLSILTKTIPGGIATFEISDLIKIKSFSDEFCHFAGKDIQKYVASCENIMSIVYPDDRMLVRNAVYSAASQKKPINITYRCFYPDKSIHYVNLYATSSDTQGKENERADVATYVAFFMDVTEEMESRNKIEHEAQYDKLTNIYNRETFTKRTEKLLKEHINQKYTMVRVDIDRFKVINDLFGMEVGDRILKAIADDFRREFMLIGTFGRLDADNFVFCVPEDSLQYNELVKRFDGLFDNMHLNYRVISRFGIYNIDDISVPIDIMCDRANLALATIKGSYIKRYAFYDDNIRNSILKEQEIVDDMDNALNEGQFVIYLQPVFSTTTKKPISAEALVRWNHPKKGLIFPWAFIPIFEHNGFITKLDMYVWEQVCRYLSDSKKNGRPIVPISTNMSRIDIYNPDLCKIIENLAQKYDIDHSYLRFEITESAYTDDSIQLISVINRLQNSGFSIMMDDFGSGYSSLNVLKNIPVDIMKIDRDFVNDIEDNEKSKNVLGSVIHLARRLGIPVVAEGVETEKQYEYLKGIGCGSIQGYFFSKPIPTAEFDWLMQQLAVNDSDKGDSTNDNIKSANVKERCVIIVDRNDDEASTIYTLLDKNYYVVREKSLEDTVDTIKKSKLSDETIVIYNIMPSIQTSFDKIEKLRNNPVFKNVPLIVLYDGDAHEAEIMSLEYGVNDFIPKPVDPVTVLLKVENLFRLTKISNKCESIETIINELPGGVIVMELSDGIHVRYVSEGLARMSMCNVNDYMKAYSDNIEERIIPEDRERVINFANSAGKNITDECTVDYRIMLPDGKIQWHEVLCKFIRKDGEKRIFYCVVTDVTEKKKSIGK